MDEQWMNRWMKGGRDEWIDGWISYLFGSRPTLVSASACSLVLGNPCRTQPLVTASSWLSLVRSNWSTVSSGTERIKFTIAVVTITTQYCLQWLHNRILKWWHHKNNLELFPEVEVSSGGYFPSHESSNGKVNIYHYSPTLRGIILF